VPEPICTQLCVTNKYNHISSWWKK